MIFKLASGFMLLLLIAFSGASKAAEANNTADQAAIAVFALGHPIFNSLDCEKDGSIERGEVDEHFPEVFFHYDRDRSKTISRNEYVIADDANLRLKQEKAFTSIDTDGDGDISTTEYRLHLIKMIGIADINSDGEVTLEEIAKLNKSTEKTQSK